MTPNKKKDSNENPLDLKSDQEVEDIESSYDNESTIKSNSGILSPGMSIKLREKLDPNA